MLLTAREAADKLGVKLDTLYAYVSRGRLQSVAVPGTRERRYRSEDVAALRDNRSGARPAQSSDPEQLMPVIGSSICLIENGRFYYRGRDAVRLSTAATLEEIARLLWLDGAGGAPPFTGGVASAATASGLIERCQIQLTTLGDDDLSSFDLTRAGTILNRLAHSARTRRRDRPRAALTRANSSPARRGVAVARGGRRAAAPGLVLIADHEPIRRLRRRRVASTEREPRRRSTAAL